MPAARTDPDYAEENDMQRRTLLHTIALAPLAATGGPTRAQPGDGMAATLRTRAAAEGMGLAAAVIDASGVASAYAGRRSTLHSEAPDADTRFEYGSLTKTFVALLLADMVVRKQLALDDPVEAVLDQRLRDLNGVPLTWADLAAHRSGLPRLPSNLRPKVPADPYADYSADMLRAFIDGWKPDAPRDTRWEYSNLGFGLLGHALGRRAGRPLADLLRAQVLAPLKLDEIQFALTGRPVAGLATGHDAQRQPVPAWHFDALAGAGALVGSARSLARYAQAALGLVETPLDAAFKLALAPRAATRAPAQHIGLAWLIVPLKQRQVTAHDGGTFGFSSSLMLDREGRRGALVLANASVVVNDLAAHLLDPSLPLRDPAAELAQTQRPAATVNPASLVALAGTYALNPQFKLRVRTADGRLFAQATGQGEFELFASGARRFFARVTALEIEFDGETGPAPTFVLRQGGQALRFVREAGSQPGQ
jgi:CubicO group peptidase (beta-lactamase class C family)